MVMDPLLRWAFNRPRLAGSLNGMVNSLAFCPNVIEDVINVKPIVTNTIPIINMCFFIVVIFLGYAQRALICFFLQVDVSIESFEIEEGSSFSNLVTIPVHF